MEFTTLLNTSLELNTFSDQQRVDSLPSSDSYVDERGVLKEELKRLIEENKELTQLLNAMQENYDSLKEQMINSSSERKRRAETRNLTKEEHALSGESSSIDRNCSKKPRQHESIPMISRVLVKMDASDASLIVKDEYKWRKYGQKVTKGNPFPKAYFKCGSPNCPVKKKVQRSMEDQGIVVVTYQGEHNHAVALNSDTGVAKCTSSRSSLEPKATKQKVSGEESASFNANPEVQKMFMEKMASNLVKDSSLRDALAAAISERFLVQSIHK